MAQTLKFGNKTWATKVGSTLAYNDENGNYKPLPFAFTRSTSATRVNKEGLIEVVTNDRPRIDYTDTSDGVLLLENAATNLVTYSEDFSNAAWNKGNLTVTANQAISPYGSQTADKVTPDSITNAIRLWNTQTTTATTYSLSFFVKYNGKQYVQLLFGGNLNPTVYSNFDLINGTVTSGTGKIEDYGNGWYRISLTAVLNAATDQVYLWSIDNANSSRGATSTGNGTDGYYIFGAMLEQNSVASSYIPTQGSASTRVAETASGAGNSEVFNSEQGVLFADFNYENINPNWSGLGIMDSSADRVIFAVQNNTQNFKVYLQSGGVVRWNPTVIIDVTKYQKVAVKYKSNDNALWINGFEVASDNTVSIMPSGLHKLSYFGYGNLEPTYGKTKEIGYYDTILTDLELETLTSYKSWTSMVNELNLNIIYNG